MKFIHFFLCFQALLVFAHDSPHGAVSVDFLSPLAIRVTGDYRDSLRSEFTRRNQKRFDAMKKNRMIRPYILAMEYRSAAARIVSELRPQIYDAWNRPSDFRLTDSKSRVIPLVGKGYQIHSADALLFPDTPAAIRQYAVLHQSYFSLKTPLVRGMYVLRAPFGEKVSFVYDPEKSVSPVFQTNHFGYSPNGRKIIPLDLQNNFLSGNDWKNNEYFLIDPKTGQKIRSGKISSNGKEYWIDISGCHRIGNYSLHVPAIGCSKEFQIHPDSRKALYRAYLARLKKLRCSAHCHLQTAQDDLPWELQDCIKKVKQADRGFFTQDGERITLSISKLLYSREESTRNLIPGLTGGWHDPDGGKNPEHFSAVNDLLAAALLKGNNPELLEEALHGLDFWRKAQQKDGGVGIRVYSGSRFQLLSAVSRRGTLLYASHAAMAALVLKQRSDMVRSALFRESAIRAWKYALEPVSRMQKEYRISVKNRVTRLHYYEAPELQGIHLFKCAFDLFLLTGDRQYMKYIQTNLPRIRMELRDFCKTNSPFLLFEFQQFGNSFPELQKLHGYYMEQIVTYADRMLKSHQFSLYPLMDTRIFAAAWLITGGSKYRNALETAADLCGIEDRAGKILPEYMLNLSLTEAAERIYGLYMKPDPKNHIDGCTKSFLTNRPITAKQNKLLLKRSFETQKIQIYESEAAKKQDDLTVARLAGSVSAVCFLMMEGSQK